VAVHRRGIDPAATPTPTQSLGHVLVTIDDLRALIELIKSHDGKSLPVEIEFSGGSLDEADDLRELSDIEMSRITLKTSEMEIELSDIRARCVGDLDVATLVYNRWARPRQLRGGSIRLRRAKQSWFWVALFGLLTVLLWISYLSDIFASDRSSLLSAVFCTAFCLVVIVVEFRSVGRLQSAKIYPGTLDEYRKEQLGGKRQLITWLIAISAVSVSIISVLVTILLKR
jgi:hypothetical protein